MRINPVYLKDLKLNVRSIKFALLIFTYNLCFGIAIILFLYIGMHKGNGQLAFDYESCEQMYSLISGMELVSIFFIVPALTAGAVAGEREKHTLDLLLTSKLKALHFICGKMAYVVTVVFVIIISGFPLTTVLTVTRSMPAKLELQFLILLFVTSLYVTSVGIFFSTIKNSTISAAVWTYVFLILITVGTIVLYNLNGYMREDMRIHNANEFSGIYYMFLLNPLSTYVYMFFGSRQSGIVEWVPAFMQSDWIEFSIFIQMLTSMTLIGISSYVLKMHGFKKSFLPKSRKRKTL
ncbi:ABC transporter permease [[Clostridium] polysaccharolyticum]|uniref:ABC-2 family transporter protein n=1 Tax=[Clostridium] polysaccharolyticum TaxID=29364 RepID=A0A1H9ZEU2_9FIRM|nr:ABC transporter permease subunit [[Clostridium] polysaccharolyticum]SES80032.1 ABC-2 family transporter protein [[Clostridium] polysaccharolyticum]